MAGLRRRTSRVVHNNTSIRCGEETMLKATILFALGLCANVLVGLPAMAQAPAEVTLTRLDCGTGASRRRRPALHRHLRLQGPQAAVHVQLLRDQARRRLHGLGHGLSAGLEPNAPKVGIVDRLAQLKITAGAGEVRRHQPLPRRPHRPARAVHERDAADRQGRLGRRSPRRRRCRAPTSRGFKNWIERRRQGRAADRRTRTCSATAA